MSDTRKIRSGEEDVIVERGGQYDHETYGPVTVTGIWKGVHQVDRARNTTDTGTIIIRFAPDQNEEIAEAEELIDTLDEFLAAIE